MLHPADVVEISLGVTRLLRVRVDPAADRKLSVNQFIPQVVSCHSWNKRSMSIYVDGEKYLGTTPAFEIDPLCI